MRLPPSEIWANSMIDSALGPEVINKVRQLLLVFTDPKAPTGYRADPACPFATRLALQADGTPTAYRVTSSKRGLNRPGRAPQVVGWSKPVYMLGSGS